MAQSMTLCMQMWSLKSIANWPVGGCFGGQVGLQRRSGSICLSSSRYVWRQMGRKTENWPEKETNVKYLGARVEAFSSWKSIIFGFQEAFQEKSDLEEDFGSKFYGFGVTFWWIFASMLQAKMHHVSFDPDILEVRSVPLFTGRNGVRDRGGPCKK